MRSRAGSSPRVRRSGEDDPLVEIQTDKATVDIPSPYAGTVLSILVAEGDVVPVGTELVVIGEAGEIVPRGGDRSRDTVSRGSSPRVPAASTAASGRVQATPVVRRIAHELGVDLGSVSGTGQGGRITEDDVRAAAVRSIARADASRSEVYDA